jgi:hydrogenase/urease accessory protein HupE
VRPLNLRILILGLIFAAVISASASAHESRPFYIEIQERGTGLFSVQWKAPPTVQLSNAPSVALPKTCEAAAESSGQGRETRALFRCEDGLAGQEIEIRYPIYNPSVTSLVRLTWRSGETQTLLAAPDETIIWLPTPETTSGVALQYLSLGVEHILEGYDHLLFLICLLFIARRVRRILITITGFTLAHSLTLALSALGFVRVPVPPVEAAIALSIVFLATEIARGRRETLTYRYPIAVSSSFGLLHGFGFAAVLRDIGLPQTEMSMALLFFNVGVEIGQIIFITGVILFYLGAVFFLQHLKEERIQMWTMQAAARPSAYAVGVLASYWLVERIAGFWA